MGQIRLFSTLIMGLLWATLAAGPGSLMDAPSDHAPAGLLTGRTDAGNELALPLKQTVAHMEITTNLVYATIRQVFVNDSAHNLEAVYTFPLPAKAAVTDMKLRLGDRLIQSVVKERGEARQTYEAARARGQRAALLERERPNLFTTSVANFQPGETVEIVFSYMEQLAFTGKVYEIVFPTTFGPRYFSNRSEEGAGTQNLPAKAARQRLNPATLDFTDHFLKWTARVEGLPIAAIDSPTHSIWVEEPSPESYRISLNAGEVLPDRDLTLRLALVETTEPKLIFQRSQGKLGHHGLLTIFPPLVDDPDIDAVAREVIFLIDTSGSMAGLPLKQAREGLHRCLEMLNPEDRFNIVRFSHDYSGFRPTSQETSATHLDAARQYVDVLSADGGTEMQAALRHVLDMPEPEGLMRVIFFLTDGDVGDEDSLLRLVDRRLKGARIFAFGVGSAPNEFLLRKLSEHGHGVSTFIRGEDDIGAVMADVFETINAPALTDVEVSLWDQAGERLESGSVYPAVVPDLFLGRPLQLCYRHDGPFEGRIDVGGWMNGEWATYSYFTDAAPSAHFPGIERLYGQAVANDRMVDWIHAATTEEKERIKAEIVDTALAYQLLTRFTSRVAVESKVRQGPLDLMSVAVPAMTRHGTGDGAYFAPTATRDHARLLAAAVFLLLGLGFCLKKERSGDVS